MSRSWEPSGCLAIRYCPTVAKLDFCLGPDFLHQPTTASSCSGWSTWTLARALTTFLLAHVLPREPVFLASEDTVAEHSGPTVFGKGRHRDGVRSTHSYTAYRWGHKGVGISVLVMFPFAPRAWALPILVALDRMAEWDRAQRQFSRGESIVIMMRSLCSRGAERGGLPA
jgi:hypothetical protein